MSKKTSKPEQEKNDLKTLDEILIDFSKEKDTAPMRYKNLVIAMKWAYHLKNTEEYKNKPTSEIIEKALADVFAGKVTKKMVDEAVEKDEAVKLEKMAEKKKKLLDE